MGLNVVKAEAKAQIEWLFTAICTTLRWIKRALWFGVLVYIAYHCYWYQQAYVEATMPQVEQQRRFNASLQEVNKITS